jgi:hypothetical protein
LGCPCRHPPRAHRSARTRRAAGRRPMPGRRSAARHGRLTGGRPSTPRRLSSAAADREPIAPISMRVQRPARRSECTAAAARLTALSRDARRIPIYPAHTDRRGRSSGPANRRRRRPSGAWRADLAGRVLDLDATQVAAHATVGKAPPSTPATGRLHVDAWRSMIRSMFCLLKDRLTLPPNLPDLRDLNLRSPE